MTNNFAVAACRSADRELNNNDSAADPENVSARRLSYESISDFVMELVARDIDCVRI